MKSKNTHTTKDGKKILISEMDTPHLLNTMRLIERNAIQGVKIRRGGGSSPDDFWYEEYTVRGDKALAALNYEAYAAEYKRRQKPPFMGFDELRRK